VPVFTLSKKHSSACASTWGSALWFATIFDKKKLFVEMKPFCSKNHHRLFKNPQIAVVYNELPCIVCVSQREV
jgi:hypothetical protein